MVILEFIPLEDVLRLQKTNSGRTVNFVSKIKVTIFDLRKDVQPQVSIREEFRFNTLKNLIKEYGCIIDRCVPRPPVAIDQNDPDRLIRDINRLVEDRWNANQRDTLKKLIVSNEKVLDHFVNREIRPDDQGFREFFFTDESDETYGWEDRTNRPTHRNIIHTCGWNDRDNPIPLNCECDIKHICDYLETWLPSDFKRLKCIDKTCYRCSCGLFLCKKCEGNRCAFYTFIFRHFYQCRAPIPEQYEIENRPRIRVYPPLPEPLPEPVDEHELSLNETIEDEGFATLNEDSEED